MTTVSAFSSAQLLIVGTDTGVGKTCVTAALVRYFRGRGEKVAALKPLETGVDKEAGDAGLLARAAGWPEERFRELSFIRLPPPVSPELAARLTGCSFRLEEVAVWMEAWSKRASGRILAEGVGGLLVPLTRTETLADLAVRLGWPLVVVCPSTLGTINHTLLTMEAARIRGIPVSGVIMNRGWDPENAWAISHFSGVPVLGYLGEVPASRIPEGLEITWLKPVDAARLPADIKGTRSEK